MGCIAASAAARHRPRLNKQLAKNEGLERVNSIGETFDVVTNLTHVDGYVTDIYMS